MGSQQELGSLRTPWFTARTQRQPRPSVPPAETALPAPLAPEVVLPGPFSDTLIAGEALPAGRQLECPSQEYSALTRGDGNFVVYRNDDWTQLWASGTSGHRDGFVEVRDDGGVFVCDSSGTPVWGAGTAGNPGAFVQLHDDGRLAVYSFYRDLLWSSTPLP